MHQGKYPVVYLSFKDVKADSWEETYRKIRLLIAAEFRRHHELSSSSQLDAFERQKFACLASETADKVDYESSLSFLMLFLHKHHGVAPIVIIDEYDTPIQQGHLHGFYDTVLKLSSKSKPPSGFVASAESESSVGLVGVFSSLLFKHKKLPPLSVQARRR